MNFADIIVTSIPLENIWTEKGQLSATRTSYLQSEDIKNLLRSETIQFVVADVGHLLKWVAIKDSFEFWKNEIQSHLADNLDKIDVDFFPNNYAYIASRWVSELDPIIILLERLH
ncbi:MAG: hypothetical protein C5B59_14665 [Bacteroidetes bacterium]|nr:MAG: hypothetical protein C5B59_14665 [Bacteroidota bacterium]